MNDTAYRLHTAGSQIVNRFYLYLALTSEKELAALSRLTSLTSAHVNISHHESIFRHHLFGPADAGLFAGLCAIAMVGDGGSDAATLAIAAGR